MARCRLGIGAGLLVAMAVASGCAFGKKPYAFDPLVKGRAIRWGDREKARQVEREAPPEPAAPAAPELPLVGSGNLASQAPLTSPQSE